MVYAQCNELIITYSLQKNAVLYNQRSDIKFWALFPKIVSAYAYSVLCQILTLDFSTALFNQMIFSKTNSYLLNSYSASVYFNTQNNKHYTVKMDFLSIRKFKRKQMSNSLCTIL